MKNLVPPKMKNLVQPRMKNLVQPRMKNLVPPRMKNLAKMCVRACSWQCWFKFWAFDFLLSSVHHSCSRRSTTSTRKCDKKWYGGRACVNVVIVFSASFVCVYARRMRARSQVHELSDNKSFWRNKTVCITFVPPFTTRTTTHPSIDRPIQFMSSTAQAEGSHGQEAGQR